MSSTNKTTYYELSQYVGTDIINPLTDFNGDNEKIDTALHNVAVVGASNTTDIATLNTKVGQDEVKIDALETQNGSDALITAAQTLSGAVNELKNINDTQSSTISAHTTSIDNLGSRLTTAEGEITRVENELKTLHVLTVQGDGVKTLAELMYDAATQFLAIIRALPDDGEIDLSYLHVPFINEVEPNAHAKYTNATTSLTFGLSSIFINTSGVPTIMFGSISSSDVAICQASIMTFTGSNAYSNWVRSSDVVASTESVRIYYSIH